MKTSTILAALLGISVSARFIPRQESAEPDPECEEEEYGSGSKMGNSGNSPSSMICGATGETMYTVVSGDTLTSIAKKYHSGICDIAKVNHIKNPNLIFPGEKLKVPENCVKPDNTTCLPPPSPNATATCVPGVGSTYNVRSGDTLSAIAKNFNITLAALEAANPQIKNFNAISVGQIINIPICPDSTCDHIGTYTIKSGDLFVDLAAKYHTTIGQIEALNPNVDPTKTQPGQMIILPEDCHNITSSAV